MAAQLVPPEIIPLSARIFGIRGEHSFLQSDQSVHQFEYGPWRIGGLDSPVEHGLVRIRQDFVVVGTYVCEHLHVYSGTGYQCKDFACRRFYGHETADLVLHQHLPVMLEFRINGGRYVLSGNGLLVHFPVLVSAFNLVVRVPEIDIVAFFPFQVFFACRLYPGLARVVTGTVAFMGLDEVRVHFGDIAEQIAPGIVGVFPYIPGLTPESWKLVCDFGELHVSFRSHLLYHHHALISDTSSVPVISLHFLPHCFQRYVEGFAEGQSIEGFHFLRRHQKIICYLVSYQNLPVSVIYDASRRIDYGINHGIVACVYLVLLVDYLDDEKPDQYDGYCGRQTDFQFVRFVQFHSRPPISFLRN